MIRGFFRRKVFFNLLSGLTRILVRIWPISWGRSLIVNSRSPAELHARNYREEISVQTAFSVPKPSQPACLKPVDDIVFVKTHKTGSSTLQNIFRRYGLKNDLEIAMPVKDGNRFEYPYFFKSTFMKKSKYDLKPRIIANHLRASPGTGFKNILNTYA